MADGRAQVRLDADVLAHVEAAAYDWDVTLTKAANRLLREAFAHECDPASAVSADDMPALEPAGGVVAAPRAVAAGRVQLPAKGRASPRLSSLLRRNAGI